MVKNNRFVELMDARAGATSFAGGDRDDQQRIVRSPGRPRHGKRSNPDYKQISALIRKDTHRNVVRALFDETTDRDVSDLLQALLEDWLRGREGAVRTKSHGA